MKVIIDTNIFISVIIMKSRVLKDFLDCIGGEHTLCFSETLIQEVLSVFLRFKATLKAIQVFQDIVSNSELFDPDQNIKACRDPKDDFLLDLCEVSEAELLITGDKDLLVLKQWEITQIVTPKEFMGVMN